MSQSILLSNGQLVNVPEGADPDDYRKFAEAMAARAANPKTTKPRRAPGRRPSKRRQYARMQSVLAQATLTLVERAKAKQDEIPFDGRPVPYDSDDTGDTGLESPL